jgi:hypothetical protein
MPRDPAKRWGACLPRFGGISAERQRVLLYITHYLFQSPTYPMLQALLAPVILLSHLYGHVCKAWPALAHLA